DCNRECGTLRLPVRPVIIQGLLDGAVPHWAQSRALLTEGDLEYLLEGIDCLAVSRYVIICKAHAPLCPPALANFAKPPCASLVAFVIAHMQSSAELAPVRFLCRRELLTSLTSLQAHIPDLARHDLLLQASENRPKHTVRNTP